MDVPRSIRTHVWPAGIELHRGVRHEHPSVSAFVPGLGASRFAPIEGAAHTYLATTAFGALLESVLHDATPPEPRIQRPTVERWFEARVKLLEDVRLIDLRDAELERHGIARHELVAAAPRHYPCTRRWAAQLHDRAVGGQQTHGLLWHSRQSELHAVAIADRRPALRDLLDEHPTEVAVLWAPPVGADVLAVAEGGLGALHDGLGWDYLRDVMALLDILMDPG